MTFYGELVWFRMRQVLGDVGVLVWAVLWWRIGVGVHRTVSRLAAPGRTLEDAGSGFAGSVTRAGDRISDLPLVGGRLQPVFDGIADAGRGVAAAGEAQQAAVAEVALWLAVIVAVLPVLYLLSRYVPARFRYIRDASTARRLRDRSVDLSIFAYRAVANRPLRDLVAATNDPGAALARGDYAPLARLELRALGLRTDPGPKTAR